MDKKAEALISSLERYYRLVYDLQESCRHILHARELHGFRGPPAKATVNLAGRKDIASKTLRIAEGDHIPFYAEESSTLATERAATLEKEDQFRRSGIHQGTQIGDSWQRRDDLEARIMRAELDALIRMVTRMYDCNEKGRDLSIVPDPALTIQALKAEIRHVLKTSCKVSLVKHLRGDDRKIFCNGQRSSRKVIERLLSKPRRAEWKKERAREHEAKSARARGIPLYQSWFPSTEEMNNDQKSFYKKWVREWKKGNCIDVEGQTSYLYCYLEQCLKPPWQSAAEELLRVCDAYGPGSPSLAHMGRMWASDCFVVDQAYSAAVRVLPEPPLVSCFSKLADNRMSLRLLLHQETDAHDLLLLDGPRVTLWGRENLPEIVLYMNAIIQDQLGGRKRTLLEEWAEKTWNRSYSVFNGTQLRVEVKIRNYSFSRESFVLEYVRSLARKAENTLREERDLPRIGEGWVSETALYYEIKDALPGCDVIRHARPEWLVPQHLDVFVLDFSVAIEYQGVQHDRPIDFFGGKEGFEALRKRDARKRRLCKAHGVRLLYVREGYELSKLLDEIRQG